MTKEQLEQQANEELNAMQYEFFLKKAFQHDKRITRAHKSELLNLIATEQGLSSKEIGTREKQIEAIKKRFLKAFEILLTLDDYSSKTEEIKQLIEEVEYLNSSYSIIKLVEKGSDICTG